MQRAAVLVALVGSFSLGPAHATARTESHSYLGGPGDATVVACPVPACPAEFLGGASFSLDGQEARAVLSIDDAVSSGTAGFFRISGSIEASGAFCGTVTTPVPAGSVVLTVYVSEAYAPADCGGPAVGTIGTVTATFA